MITPLDPDIARFRDEVNGAYARLSAGGVPHVAERRRIAEQVRAPWAAGGPDMASVRDLTVGPNAIRVRIYRPADDAPLPALVYLHGGGWVLFSIDTHDRLMREYAARSGCAVVGIDYRRAPETPFPAALDDVALVLGRLRQAGDSLGIDATRLAVGGDSAGANLSLATAIRERDAGRGLAAMLLNYGVFDTLERASHVAFDGADYMLTCEEMRDFWCAYLGPGAAKTSDPLARPILADSQGLPPAFFCIPECDILADENRAMAERLRAASVPVRAEVYPGAAHSFLEAVRISRLADRALSEASAWLRGCLDR
ncbi:alpha/beta hydrolase [Stakelama saccharophila]|uniref:Alpha/beta hydrolase n=1 Tax=Stakelama saccharophila TaxID=3075605 RepID=A0ABZ0BA81_9SPHN|nr:alpha/beta hydrolase [Stakelama sp. W311]WNO54107.1 alpha/beta hydrolase [Stakelama sp. W311]